MRVYGIQVYIQQIIVDTYKLQVYSTLDSLHQICFIYKSLINQGCCTFFTVYVCKKNMFQYYLELWTVVNGT